MHSVGRTGLVKQTHPAGVSTDQSILRSIGFVPNSLENDVAFFFRDDAANACQSCSDFLAAAFLSEEVQKTIRGHGFLTNSLDLGECHLDE